MFEIRLKKACCTAFLALTALASSQAQLIHPGLCHKQSDLDRMKYMVKAQVDPWYASYVEMCQDSKASSDYSVQGDSSMTEIYRDSPYTNKSAFESDSRAAYYNALRWIIEGDEAYAKKAVECLNAWTGLTYVQHSGTLTLSGSMIYVMLEAAEIMKCTYSGWSAAEIQAFGDMLVYPGYSNTTEPSDLETQGTWYWRVYMGDSGRAGNQELSGWRACMAIGIFLDNEIIYDRAYRYVAGMSHRSDDLPYEPGPAVTVSEITTTPYNIAYNAEQQSSIEDYGYDGVLVNYVLETGQCGEAARDQGHCSWGLNCLESIAEMAWSQGDDLYGLENNRLLLGLEYHTRYNLSYLQSYSDQTSAWEPTVASGEFMEQLNRCARTKCLAINPYFEYNYDSVSRGAVTGDQWELAYGHYVGRGLADPSSDAKWITRTRDYNIAQSGYEQTDSGGAYIGWGGLTFRRPDECYGDPISGFDADGLPIYAMNVLPGTIEAEHFDYSPVSGEDRIYNDTSSGNAGNTYRTDENVDIETCSEGGYNVGWMLDGEWLTYTVYVPVTGTYELQVNYATSSSTAQIRFEFNGQDVTGDVTLPSTGNFKTWATHTVASAVSLAQGVQTMRIQVSNTASGYAYNLNNITVNHVADDAFSATEAEAYCEQSGIDTETCDEGGYNVGWIQDGDWCRYYDLDLDNGAAGFDVRVASKTSDAQIEIRLDSPTGTLIGTCPITSTGNTQNWDTQSCDITGGSGRHDVYLVFTGGSGGYLFNINWFQFTDPLAETVGVGDFATTQDIGSPSLSGSATYAGGTYTLEASGADIYGTSDQFHFASTSHSDDGELIARVDSVEAVNTWSKAGIMFRESTAADAKAVMMAVRPDQQVSMQYRSTTGGATTSLGLMGDTSNAKWIKLVRDGDLFSGYYSTDGDAWTLFEQVSISMSSSIQAGLALTSHNDAALCTATFSEVTLSSSPLGYFASTTDIGAVAASGSFTHVANSYVINASGADIWGTADECFFSSQTRSGEANISACVLDVEAANTWSKAGIMFRDSLDANAVQVSVIVRPDQQVAMQWRSTTGGSSSYSGLVGDTTSMKWVKLTRTGDSFTGSYSTDGSSWTTIATQTITMNDAAEVGLAVTSHNDGTLCTASFTDVTIE